MKTTCVTISVLFLSQLCLAQNKNLDYSKAIKLYNQTTYNLTTKTYESQDTTGNYLFQTEESFQILQANIAFQWKMNNNNFHEIQLVDFRIGKHGVKSEQKNDKTNASLTYNGQYTTLTAIAIGYDYILNFNKRADRKFVPSLGIGGTPYFVRQKREPYVSHAFPVTDTRIGMKLFVSPRISYYLNSRFFLDLHIPICVSDMQVHQNQVKNPAFTSEQQKTSTVNFTQFPKIFYGRIGVGLKIQ